MRDHAAFRLEGAVNDHRNTALRTVSLHWARTFPVEADGGTKIVVHPKSREAIVKELYPRLLYTFSDVVCYVTNNPR